MNDDELGLLAAKVAEVLAPMLLGLARDTLAAQDRRQERLGQYVDQGDVHDTDPGTARVAVRLDTPAADLSQPVLWCDVAGPLPARGDRVWVAIIPPAGPLVLGIAPY